MSGITNPKGLHHTEHETGGVDAIAALDGSILTTGTIPDARLSANVALRNAANTFTAGSQAISAANPNILLTDTSGTAQNRLATLSGATPALTFATLNDGMGIQTSLILDRAGGTKSNGDFYEKGRTTPMGHWINVPYSAANFQANGGGTWTVGAGAVVNNAYTLIGKTLFWQLYVAWFGGGSTLVSPSAGTVLTVAAPPGMQLIAGGNQGQVAFCVNGGVYASAVVQSQSSYVQLTALGAAWAAGSPGFQMTTCWLVS